MSLNVDDLDVAQLRLFRSGVPDFELWAEDPEMRALPMTRELYAAFASRRWYIGRAARLPQHLREDPAEHRRFLARLRFERRLWQADYTRRVREATVAHFASAIAASKSRQLCIGCCRSWQLLGLTCHSILTFSCIV